MRSTKDYRAGIESMGWRDYVRHLPLLVSSAVHRGACKLGHHEWHWFRQTGGRKKKICVHCDVHAHKETL